MSLPLAITAWIFSMALALALYMAWLHQPFIY